MLGSRGIDVYGRAAEKRPLAQRQGVYGSGY